MRSEILLITHADGSDTEATEQILRREGWLYRILRPYRGEPLPDPDDPDRAGIICLGGPMSAYQEPTHPFLADEKRQLRRAVQRGIPVLGICLGAQLLAEALGGRARGGPELECGAVDVALTAAGHRDPVLRGLAGPFFSFHSDTFDPPPGAHVLATTERYLQAFRSGSAVGLQFHPEITPNGIKRLFEAERAKIAEFAAHPESLATPSAAEAAAAQQRFTLLMLRWLATLPDSGSETEQSESPTAVARTATQQ
jgi:GMP synthase (glutamine-hydrolysing)